jgi:hypothetical protein
MKLSVPPIANDDMLTAALKYAEPGWYGLPVRAGAGKNPGSVVGKGWQHQSSRDPQQLAAWFAGTDYLLALHVGRSGAVVFDVDDPDRIPDQLAAYLHGPLCPPHQSSRPDQPGRGHFVFRQPPGRMIGNSTGRLGKGWGEVRGKNGVIIVAPSRHARDADGARYEWLQTGEVPSLPDELAELLPDAGESTDAATDEEVRRFIATHNSARHPGKLQGPLNKFAADVAAGASRHESFVRVACWAMREVVAGDYTAAAAVAQLQAAFVAAMATSRDGIERVLDAASAQAEADSVIAWAIAQAEMESPEIGTQNPQNSVTAVPAASSEGFEGASPEQWDPPTPLPGRTDPIPTDALGPVLGPLVDAVGVALQVDEVARMHEKGTTERAERASAPSPVDTGGDHEPIDVVPFPTLHQDALIGLPGKIIDAVAPYTEAHPAAMLVQYLAEYGALIGPSAHVEVDNRRHPARLYPLIVGRTSSGAKGTSYGVARALFRASERADPEAFGAPLRRVSGLSSGEGLIQLVRDGNPDNDDDPGVTDKRLLVVEEEFASVLAVMERQGNILPATLRDAWDGNRLQTLTKSAPLCATNPHITVIGHITPGELSLRLSEAQMAGGTMNRFLPIASRRTKLLPDGGNIPREVLAEYGPQIADTVEQGRAAGWTERTPDASRVWRQAYARLRRDRPDGPVATILARAAPQVLRLSLTYALADGSFAVEEVHMTAALALWRYVEDTAVWMFGAHIDSGEVEQLVAFVAAGGNAGRTKSEISCDLYKRNKPAGEINAALGELMSSGRIREKKDSSGRGRPTIRYFAC